MKTSTKHFGVPTAVALFMLSSPCSAQIGIGVDNPAAETSQNERKEGRDAGEATSRPKKVQEAVDMLTKKYGEPNLIGDDVAMWMNSGPFLYTMVWSEEVKHNFPMAHTDFVQQGVRYDVPTDKLTDLAEYDGSVYVDRTKGVLSARCDKEEMNLLALNLANDIITGKKTVKDARAYYAKAAMMFMKGEKDPYTQKLQFTPKASSGFPDEPFDMKEMGEMKPK